MCEVNSVKCHSHVGTTTITTRRDDCRKICVTEGTVPGYLRFASKVRTSPPPPPHRHTVTPTPTAMERRIFSYNDGAPVLPQRSVTEARMEGVPENWQPHGSPSVQAPLSDVIGRIAHLEAMVRNANYHQAGPPPPDDFNKDAEEIQELKKTNKNLEQTVSLFTDKTSAQKAEIDSLTTHVETLQREHTDLETKHTQLQQGHEKLKTTHDALKKEANTLRADRDAAQEYLEQERQANEEHHKLEAEAHNSTLDTLGRANRKYEKLRNVHLQVLDELDGLRNEKNSSGRRVCCFRCHQLGIECGGQRPGCTQCEEGAGAVACTYVVCRYFRHTKTCGMRRCSMIHDEVGFRIRDGVLSGGLVEREEDTRM